MTVAQIYSLMNTVTEEVLGQSGLVTEDLSNVVDVGTQIFNASAVDAYVRSLVNHIGKVVFVNRPYSGNVPSVLMDSWQFGSVLEKIQADIPAATENDSWDLQDGQSYDPNIFYKPTVSAKFYNSRVTFEVPLSFTERQVKQSFSNVEQLNGFLSMLYNAVDKSMAIKLDALIMRTISAFMADTIIDEYGADALSSKSGVRAVNLLYLYNQQTGGSLTAAKAISDPDFVRFASYMIGLTAGRLSKISTLFNIGQKERFTPPDMLHIVLLDDFKRAADVYLQSDVFHNELTELPAAESVPYWQGSGEGYAFGDTSTIKVQTASGTITASGIIGVMFDRDALGVSCLERRTTTNYNPRAEFYTNWAKMDAGYFNDENENFVVFFVA